MCKERKVGCGGEFFLIPLPKRNVAIQVAIVVTMMVQITPLSVYSRYV